MTWIISDDDQRKAIEEIEQTKSDRAAGIVAAAFVERDLINAIEARLLKDDTLIEKLFKPTGALGAFETKANLGFLLGIYDAEVHADITDIVWIRNRFAHNRQPLKFDSRDIRTRIDGLRIIKRPEYPKVPGIGLPDQVRSPPRLESGASPREKLILTVKLLAVVFWAASYDLVLDEQGRAKTWKEAEPRT